MSDSGTRVPRRSAGRRTARRDDARHRRGGLLPRRGDHTHGPRSGRPSRVPIGCGGEPLDGTNEWPSAWSESADALAEIVAPGADEPTYYDAESVLVETLASATTPVTIVVLGPLTNIAAVLQTDPSLAGRIEQIVVMGGAVSVAGNVEPELSAEWNLHAHPGAAQAVITPACRSPSCRWTRRIRCR